MRTPIFHGLKLLSVAALACIGLTSPAIANETVTYLCTPGGGEPDAVATYETVGGGSVLHLATIENGKSDAGIWLAEIPYPPAQFTSLAFYMQGDPDAAHGPYLIMDGVDKHGNASTMTFNVAKTKLKTIESDGFTKYKIERNDLGIEQKTFEPIKMYLQVYAGPKAGVSFNFYGFNFNGNGFSYRYGDIDDCYVGATVP